jgi:murein DD-endopeptidase MepM/ murein hydrolase activator NlpD
MANSDVYQYIIQPGDTLWSIAEEYDLTVDEIVDLNPGIDPYNLQVGQAIVLPLPEEIPDNEQLRWGPWGGPWGGPWVGPWGSWGRRPWGPWGWGRRWW